MTQHPQDTRKLSNRFVYLMTYASPLGLLTAAAEDEVIVALVMEGQKREFVHIPACAANEDTALLQKCRDWLDAYFAGRRPDAGHLPLAPRGTPFQLRVWRELLQIPYGETRTYLELSKRLSSSPRAVGGAVARNPISILIPCHRVVGTGGGLTGYDGGLARKRWLLALENGKSEP